MSAIPSILVIEDNISALRTLSQLLSAFGIKEVCEAESAERALEILRTKRFSIILADYRLDGMDGVEFLEQLRAEGDQTPVLVISGAPDKVGVIRATNQPKADFFGKPFRMAELMGAMEKLVAA